MVVTLDLEWVSTQAELGVSTYAYTVKQRCMFLTPQSVFLDVKVKEKKLTV